MTQVSSSSVWGIAERIVVTPVGKVRSEIVRLLGQRGFALTTDQLTVVEGNRGSAFAGASRSASKVPVQVRVRLTAGDPGCAIWLEVKDNWKLPMSRPVAVYQEIIGDLVQALDEVLRRLDPLAPPFPEPMRSWHAFVESDGGADRASAKLSQVANRYLDNDAGDAPKGWRDKGIVSVVTPRGVADLPIDTLYGMVTAGALVASKPGPMPSRLVSQVELVVGMFERLLETAGSWSGNSWIELDDKSVPVVEFLVQQARIRDSVPLRTLQVCVTCRLARVVNPDYARLRSRTNKLRTLQSSVGAIISTQGISPFVLIGKLSQLNQLDPEFVCPRCQGLHAENSIITFCPHCGEQRDESALRECPKCAYDFRSLVKTKDLWREGLPMPAIDQFPRMPGVPAAGSPVYPPATTDTSSASYPPTPFPVEPHSGQPFGTQPPYLQQPLPAAQHQGPSQFPAEQPYQGAATIAVDPSGGAVAGLKPLGEQHLLPAWYPDPSGRHQFRWWNGIDWAEFVLNNDQHATDPL